MNVSVSWSNSGPQFEFQNNEKGERIWIIRNPFRLQYNTFGFSIGGAV